MRKKQSKDFFKMPPQVTPTSANSKTLDVSIVFKERQFHVVIVAASIAPVTRLRVTHWGSITMYNVL